MIIEVLFVLLGYLIGSLPTGVWLARYKGISDITQYGSGNIGATNIARVLGPQYFFLVFFIDSFKAFIYLKLLMLMPVTEPIIMATAIALLVGNGISLFLLGKGGKGVATSIGIIIALKPLLLNVALMIWLLSMLVTKNVGISSVLGLLSLPLITFYICPHNVNLLLLIFFICVWGLWRHEYNIKKFFFSSSNT